MNHKHQTKVDQKTIHNQREKKERRSVFCKSMPNRTINLQICHHRIIGLELIIYTGNSIRELTSHNTKRKFNNSYEQCAALTKFSIQFCETVLKQITFPFTHDVVNVSSSSMQNQNKLKDFIITVRVMKVFFFFFYHYYYIQFKSEEVHGMSFLRLLNLN